MGKIVGINTCNFGSTGIIMINTLKMAENIGFETYTSFSGLICKPIENKKNQLPIYFSKKTAPINYIINSKLGLTGCGHIVATYKFLKQLNRIKPDILHLHNLHGDYINFPILFNWIKKKKVKVVWTLHDCWSFTGHCPHFDYIGCNKWEKQCFDCPLYTEYPQSAVDNSRYMYKIKKFCFTGVKDLTIVTPSEWLAKLVKKSFLKKYKVKVINNGIDLDCFKPTESNLREELGIVDKTILMGCAFPFTNLKGLDVFVELASKLDDNYRIVLVGLNEEQIKTLPKKIIGVKATKDKTELSKYYTMADIFINPTKEEVLGLVNLEALACGTPVVTFDSGGSPECIDENCGIVVPRDNTEEMLKSIEYIIKNKPFRKEACIERANKFDINDKYKEYINLYDTI